MAATRDGRPHRWVNSDKKGATIFATTTCLDFVPAFGRPEMRELASVSLLRDCQRYGISLHAFVVMTHHLHLLLDCPPEQTASWVMQRLKSNLAKLALPLLTAQELALLSKQSGLNQRSFWKPSYRGLEISSTQTFYQKVRYIHLNPVRAELAQEPKAYRWSSRRFWDQELWQPVGGLILEQVLRGFDESINTNISGD